MQKDMLERARAHRDSHTYTAENYEEFKEIINTKPGFVKAIVVRKPGMRRKDQRGRAGYFQMHAV